MQFKRILFLLLAVALTLPVVAGAQTVVGCPCVVSNVSGTAVYPPQSCPLAGYVGSMQITSGLPAGSTIDLVTRIGFFSTVGLAAGGSLGGEIQTWSAYLYVQATGTGALAGYSHNFQVPVSGITHSAPRTYGDAVQSFDHNLMSLDGQLFGDPDFCVFRVKAGPLQSYPPSPGHTTFTRVGPPGSDFQIDGFFDIAWHLEFQGCPGSPLDGMGGANDGADRHIFCEAPTPVEPTSWGGVKALYN